MPDSNELSAISWASTFIGFVSFALTVFTLLKVSIGNLRTLASASSEVPFYLTNLKQELFEERLHLRRARRRAERYIRHCHRDGKGIPSWDAAPTIRLLEATVRQLCKKFKELEKPFLLDRRDRFIGGRTGMPSSGLEMGEKDRDPWQWDDYMEGGFENDYAIVTLFHRFSWLRRKSAVQSLGQALERLQIRRIGRETTDALTEIKALKSGMLELTPIAGEPESSPGRGGGDVPKSGGTRQRMSQNGGRQDDGCGESDDSESPWKSDIEKEKIEKAHVRQSSRYRM